MSVISPRVGKLTGLVSWPDGTPFNGYAECALIVPGINGAETPWPRLTGPQGYPTQRLPLWTRIKITEGAFSQDTGLIYNDDIRPFSTRYVAFYYDSAGVQCGGPTPPFIIAGPQVEPNTVISVSPVFGEVIPTPAEVV